MKNRIFSILVTLVLAVSLILGVAVAANAEGEMTGSNTGANINLAENITVGFAFDIANAEEGAYAVIALPGEKTEKVLLADAMVAEGKYVFYAEIAIKDLADDVTVTVYKADDTATEITKTVSALAVADAYTAPEYAGLISALKAYAAAAEAYFAGESVATPAEFDFSGVADAKVQGTLPAGITHRSATLLLESETTIRHYFELADGKSINAYNIYVDLDKDGKCDPAEVLTASSKKATDETTVYYVDIEGITPNELDVVYDLVVEAGEDKYTYSYGALTYAKRTYTKDGASANAKNIAAAIAGYNAGAATLKATVTFVTDGTAVEALTYEYGVETPLNVASTKEGASFVGWYDADGNKYASIPASMTGNLTLTARFAVPFSHNTAYGEAASGVRYYCYNHVKDGDTNKCSTCGYCYENEACVGNTTACADCGKIDIGANGSAVATWNSSTGDKWVGYGYKLALESGKNVQLLAKNSGTAYAVIKPGAAALNTNLFAFTMELGIPSAEQIAEVETNPNIKLAANANIDLIVRALWTKADGNAGMHYFLDVKGGKAYLRDNSANKIDLPVGEVTKITVIFDFGNAVSGDGVSDPYTTYLVDEKGNVVASATKDPGIDISKYDRGGSFGQIRTEGAAGRVLIGNVALESVEANLISTGSSFIPYTPGVQTALPTLENTADATFKGWADADGNRIIDVPANAAGLFVANPIWVKTIQKLNFNYAENATLVASQTYCDHVDANSDGICDIETCKRCLAHVDADSDKICDVCKYATVRCSNTTANHSDVDTLDGQKNVVAAGVADKICDICGLSNVEVGNIDLGGITYSPSAEWNKGYAKGVADENGGYLVIGREYGDGPTFNTTVASGIKAILDAQANKVMTYELELKKNGNDPVLGFDLRIRSTAGPIGILQVRANTLGVQLTDDEFVKVAVVVDFDAKELRYYANGEYVSSTPFNQDYVNFTAGGYGLMQNRLSGTGSICIDSIGIYAGDLYE